MSYRQLESLLGDGALRGLAQFGTEDWFNSRNNGDLARWRRSLEALPALAPGSVELQQAVRIGDAADCSSAEQSALRQALQGLIPWRKGPFELFGVHIDTEWRSDWKWDRLRQHIAPLRGRTILDVGCGNGYHCFRMAGEGARLALGIDSQLAYALQFRMIKQYVPDVPVFVLPVTLESALDQLPAEPAASPALSNRSSAAVEILPAPWRGTGSGNTGCGGARGLRVDPARSLQPHGQCLVHSFLRYPCELAATLRIPECARGRCQHNEH